MEALQIRHIMNPFRAILQSIQWLFQISMKLLSAKIELQPNYTRHELRKASPFQMTKLIIILILEAVDGFMVF